MRTSELYAVIMAGGEGTRLWPLSRRGRPKQLIGLLGERTLFQMAVDRLRPILTPDDILVVTQESQAGALMEQAPEIPRRNYLLEPAPKGTASVIGLAAVHLARIDSGAVMACLTADHFIRNVEKFQDLLLAAREVAGRGDLVTLGISPTYPATGYGYIQRGRPQGKVRGQPVFSVAAFREKPDRQTAAHYLRGGEHTWNSGMFIWRADRILVEFERQMPALHAGLMEIDAALGAPEYESVLGAVWERLERQTIDYGIMEHAEDVVVLPADELGWWDVGSWGRLFEVLDADENGNIIVGAESIVLDSHGNLLYQEKDADRSRLVAVVGVEDLVVVDAGDVLLVCSRERAEEVRALVKQVEDRGLVRFL